MAIDVETKDCTALSDAELGEMADICADGPAGYDVGLLSKQRDEWVLISQARENDKLLGFSFCTLERIGGTPCLLWGLASVKRNGKRDQVLKGLCTDQFRRAVLAFPDEDVLIGTRVTDASAFQAFKGLEDICPRPGHKASGEERAWGRRLAKRFGIESTSYDDRAFVARGDGSLGCMFDYRSSLDVDSDVGALFDVLRLTEGDVLIAFGWAMAEYLDSLLNAAA